MLQTAHVIIDTNVLKVANREANQASLACILACIKLVEEVKKNKITVIDTDWHILREYNSNLKVTGQLGVGDQFLKWLLTNHTNPNLCHKVKITKTTCGTSFIEFPTDPALASFDLSDHKFVAVALTHTARPPIINAVDSDWYHFQQPLSRNGVTVELICPDCLKENKC